MPRLIFKDRIMFESLKKMFSSKEEPAPQPKKPETPEVIGLALGGSFTIEPMFFKTTEPSLIIEGASPSQVIQAVGVVQLDDQNRIVRYYTDDEGFLQVVQYGKDDAGVSEISLWYFYDTKAIAESDWDETLKTGVVSADGHYELEGYTFNKTFEDNAPIPLVEKTYHLDGKISETTQFIMSYNRTLEDIDGDELLLISAEERVNKQFNTVERELVYSTGVVLNKIDITTN